MANIDLDGLSTDLNTLQRSVRNAAHVQRIKIMLAAAGLASAGILIVAGTLLGQLF